MIIENTLQNENAKTDRGKTIMKLQVKIQKRIKSKTDTIIKRNLKNKRICIVSPIEKLWSQEGGFINFSGFLIDLNYDQDDSQYTITERARLISKLTLINCIQHNKSTNTLDIIFTSKSNSPNNNISNSCTTSIEPKKLKELVKILQSKSDEQFYELSQLLIQYAAKQKQMQKEDKINRSTYQHNLQDRLNLYTHSKITFIKYLNSILHNYSHQFYSYSILGKNPQSLQYESIQYGFSQGLLALIGTSISQASQLFLRLGLIDFIDRQSRFKSMIHGIKIYIERQTTQPYEIFIRTYDMLKIRVIKSYERIIQSENHDFELQAFIHRYEVDDNTLLSLLQERQNCINQDLATINNLDDVDITYTFHSEYFIDKYYNNPIKSKEKDTSSNTSNEISHD